MTVSYTHLDVYKRQSLLVTGLKAFKIQLLVLKETAKPCFLKTF